MFTNETRATTFGQQQPPQSPRSILKGGASRPDIKPTPVAPLPSRPTAPLLQQGQKAVPGHQRSRSSVAFSPSLGPLEPVPPAYPRSSMATPPQVRRSPIMNGGPARGYTTSPPPEMPSRAPISSPSPEPPHRSRVSSPPPHPPAPSPPMGYRSASPHPQRAIRFALESPIQQMVQEALKGSIEKQFLLGWMYDKGYEVMPNDKEAEKWYTLAAEGGHPIAQYNLTVLFFSKRKVSFDKTKALFWLNSAAGYEKFPEARILLGVLLETDAFGQPNLRMAQWYYEDVINKNNPNANNIANAYYRLAMLYKQMPVIEGRFRRVIKYLGKAAALGYSGAYRILGQFYEKEGKPADAFAAYQQSLERKEPGSCYEMGRCYKSNIGTKTDATIAQDYFERGARDGCRLCQNELNVEKVILSSEILPPSIDEMLTLKALPMGNPEDLYRFAAERGYFSMFLTVIYFPGIEMDLDKVILDALRLAKQNKQVEFEEKLQEFVELRTLQKRQASPQKTVAVVSQEQADFLSERVCLLEKELKILREKYEARKMENEQLKKENESIGTQLDFMQRLYGRAEEETSLFPPPVDFFKFPAAEQLPQKVKAGPP